MVTQQEPADLAQLASLLDKRPDAAPASLRGAVRTLGLEVSGCREEDRLVAAVLALYLTRSLVTSGYVRSVYIIELETNLREDFTEKAPTRVFSWLKALTSAFTFKTQLRYYAKQALTPRSLNVKLGPATQLS